MPNPLTIKVILRASEIPLDAVVMRQSDSGEYRLCTKAGIVVPGSSAKVIAENDARLLVATNGDIIAMEGSKELIWLATAGALRTFIAQSPK